MKRKGAKSAGTLAFYKACLGPVQEGGTIWGRRSLNSQGRRREVTVFFLKRSMREVLGRETPEKDQDANQTAEGRSKKNKSRQGQFQGWRM